MVSGLSQECVKRVQDMITLFLAARNPIVETVRTHQVLFLVQNITDVSEDCSEEAYPYLGYTIREVDVGVAHHGHASDHV